MSSEHSADSDLAARNPFAATDVEAILRERAWLKAAPWEPITAWCARAAELLGPHAADRDALAALLVLVFHYEAREILDATQSHAVMAREGAHAVIRELALQILDGPEIDSDRFKEIINVLKEKVGYRGRELFYPLRLALAGRVGEGELDRVILLLDSAAQLPFVPAVKGARQRMLEFCAALD